jgi:hypothetical protein
MFVQGLETRTAYPLSQRAGGKADFVREPLEAVNTDQEGSKQIITLQLKAWRWTTYHSAFQSRMIFQKVNRRSVREPDARSSVIFLQPRQLPPESLQS